MTISPILVLLIQAVSECRFVHGAVNTRPV